ncbi:hypothetical protein KBD08_04000 [Candidatus Babeliales bacterium]|nr:hypothetical protein [Candidatus Babeliales bacterium]
MKFIISSHQYLQVNTDDLQIVQSNQDYSNWSKSINVTYIDTKKNISLFFANHKARSFCYFFIEYEETQKLLQNEKGLSKNIVNDLGFEWNQFFKGDSKSNKAFKYHWMCNDHTEIRPYYNSWLYNDHDGNIIFEITPFYPWHNVTAKTNPEKIPYKEWIKSYISIVKIIIPKNKFKQWITYAKKMKKEYNL